MCTRACSRMGVTWRNELHLPSKLLLGVVVVKSLIVGASGLLELLDPNRFACFDRNGQVVRCPPHHSINQALTLFLWTIFFVFSVFSGIFYFNLYELYSAMFQSLFITGYFVFQFLLPVPNDIIDYVMVVVTCACQFAYFVFGFFLHQEYGWHLYKKVGSDQNFRAMHRAYLLWKAFFKLDILYTLVSVVLSGKGIYNTEWMAYCDWGMLFIIILVYTPLGYHAFLHERTRFAVAWMMLFPIGPTYLAGMWSWEYRFNFTYGADWSSKVLAILFSITGITAMIVKIILFILSIKVVRNFGKGLKHNSVKSPIKSNVQGDEQTEIIYDGIGGSSDDSDEGTASSSRSVGMGNTVDDDDGLSIYDVLRNTYAVATTRNAINE